MQRNTVRLFHLIMMFFIFGIITEQGVLAQSEVSLIEYSKSLLKLDEKNLYDTTVDVMHAYLTRYPDGEKTDEMLFLLGNLHMDRKNRDMAYISYLKILTLYPESPHKAKANENARSAVSEDRNLSPIKEKLYSLLITPPKASEFADTYFTLIKSLLDLVYPKLYDALISECNIFMKTYPDHPGAVQTAEWIGDMYVENNKHWDAVAAYTQVIHLYRGQGHDTACRQKTAELMTEKLRRHDMAVQIYDEIVQGEIDSVAQGEAQWRMALIMDEKLKDYQGAVQAYQILIDRFGHNPHGAEALMKKAEIHVSHLKQYTEGIETYRKIIDRFPESDLAPLALAQAGEVYEEEIKDYDRTVKVYLEVVELYPTYPVSSEKLYDAAEITEKKLKKIDQAVELYRRVVQTYGSEKIAEKARKRIEDLTKENQENSG